MKKSNIKLPSNRSFGLVFFIVFLLIAFYPLTNHEDTRLWSLFISFIFLFLGLLNSRLLLPFNKLWFKFGIFLGNLISPVVMGIVFFLVVTPTGLLMRLFQKDVLKLKTNESETYWIKVERNQSKMKNQF